MTTLQLDVIPLSPALGAEIRGVDLHDPITPEVARELRDAWHRHLVIVLRDQHDLSPEEQMRFCSIFGEIGARARPKDIRMEPSDTPQEMMFVSNRRENGKLIGVLPDGELQFHIDQCFTPAPAKGTCLYAIEIPRSGGDTMFGNLYSAWEALPVPLRQAVEGRRASQVFEFSTYDRPKDGGAAPAGRVQQASHDIAMIHPETGRQLLYVNRLMTKAIEGLDPQESDDILQQLFEHQERSEFIYTHKWREGDVLLWDNCSTIHARTDFDPTENRHLRRFTIRGSMLP